MCSLFFCLILSEFCDHISIFRVLMTAVYLEQGCEEAWVECCWLLLDYPGLKKNIWSCKYVLLHCMKFVVTLHQLEGRYFICVVLDLLLCIFFFFFTALYCSLWLTLTLEHREWYICGVILIFRYGSPKGILKLKGTLFYRKTNFTLFF